MSLEKILSQYTTDTQKKFSTVCHSCHHQDFWTDAYYPAVSTPHCFHCSPPPALSLVRQAFSFDARTWPDFQPPDSMPQATQAVQSPRGSDEEALWDTFVDVESNTVSIRRDKIGTLGFDRKREEKFNEWWKKGSGKIVLDYVFKACTAALTSR